jgi:hypothetical protein
VKLGIELAFDVATGRGDHPERTALKADMVTRWKRPNPLIHALCGQGLLSCWESGRGFGSVFPNKTKRPLAGRFVLLCASISERTASVRLSEVQWTSLGRATAGRAVLSNAKDGWIASSETDTFHLAPSSTPRLAWDFSEPTSCALMLYRAMTSSAAKAILPPFTLPLSVRKSTCERRLSAIFPDREINRSNRLKHQNISRSVNIARLRPATSS